MRVERNIWLIIVLLFVVPKTMAAADYTLGAGDIIDIKVYQQPDLSLKKMISASGKISFPTIGIIGLAGKTEIQAENLLKGRLLQSKLIKNPEVSVHILEHRSKVATVEGRVAKPGEYPIIGGVTLRQLIARAGGLLDGANTEVTIVRSGSTIQKFDLLDIFQSGKSNTEFEIVPGDLVLVESMPIPMFYTYGAVNKPGRFELEDGMTVVQALSLSGGLTEYASEKNITIIRSSESIGTSTKTSEMKASLSDKIQPDDVINVKESRF